MKLKVMVFVGAIFLATTDVAHASSIQFNTVVDVSTCPTNPPGDCFLVATMASAQTLAVGDTVDFTVTFANSSRLVMYDDDGGVEDFAGWLTGTFDPSIFTISNASITPLSLIGTLATPLTESSESGGTAHIGPFFNTDFISTGSSISFTGYRVQYTIDALITNPNSYSSVWLILQADRMAVIPDAAVPEPATLSMIGIGVAALIRKRWKRGPRQLSA
jgi:hypothetical protein